MYWCMCIPRIPATRCHCGRVSMSGAIGFVICSRHVFADTRASAQRQLIDGEKLSKQVYSLPWDNGGRVRVFDAYTVHSLTACDVTPFP